MAAPPGDDPADVVRAVLRAVRDDDAEALVELCHSDCRLAMPEEKFDGHAGVRRFIAARHGGPSGVAGGEPEHVGRGQVIVPLKIEIAVGERPIDVRATAVWTVEDGLVKAVRCVPGGRSSALVELGLLQPPAEPVNTDAVRTTWRGERWANVAGFEELECHLGKHAAISAGRRLARERRVEHVIERRDGTVALVERRYAGRAE